MLCEICGERPATLHYTKIINGQKNETHICEICANSKGDIIPKYSDFSFNQLLSGLLNFDQITNESMYTKNDPEKCLNCGLTFSQFKQVGKFGCHDCYKYFESKLEPIFRRIHGNSRHNGKVPIRSGEHLQLRKELNNLKEELKKKIALEEFEAAARIRDKIRLTEQKLSVSGDDSSVNR